MTTIQFFTNLSWSNYYQGLGEIMSPSPRLLALAAFFFFPKNLRISIITNYYKRCNGTKQWANRRALVISVMHRGGKNNTDVEFAKKYSDSDHICAYVIRKARSASALVTMLHLGLLASYKNLWGYFHHYTIIFDFLFLFFKRGYSQNIRGSSPKCLGLTMHLHMAMCKFDNNKIN